MKLFQIEEPDGSPTGLDGPGAAVGIDIAPDASGAVALALGGNAELLSGRDGERRLILPGLIRDGQADTGVLGDLLLGLRERAEKQLARPVSHAVIATEIDRAAVDAAAGHAGLVVLRVLGRAAAAALAGGVPADEAPALGAALRAEDDLFALGGP